MASLFTNKTSGQRIGIFLQKCLDGETHKDNDMKTIKVVGMVGFDSERQGVRAGEIKGFTGIDAPYEAPLNPELIVETDKNNIEESAQIVVDYLIENGIIKYDHKLGLGVVFDVA